MMEFEISRSSQPVWCIEFKVRRSFPAGSQTILQFKQENINDLAKVSEGYVCMRAV